MCLSLTAPTAIYIVSLSSDTCTYRKSLWIKACDERPKGKRTPAEQGRSELPSPHSEVEFSVVSVRFTGDSSPSKTANELNLLWVNGHYI